VLNVCGFFTLFERELFSARKKLRNTMLLQLKTNNGYGLDIFKAYDIIV